jgi:hypothetical protein
LDAFVGRCRKKSRLPMNDSVGDTPGRRSGGLGRGWLSRHATQK